MKLIEITFDRKRLKEFAHLCESLSIKIVIAVSSSNGLFDDRVTAIVNVSAISDEIPEAMKIEKLREKFGNNFKND